MIYFVGNYTQSFYSHNNNTKNLIIYLMSIKYFEIIIYAYYKAYLFYLMHMDLIVKIYYAKTITGILLL